MKSSRANSIQNHDHEWGPLDESELVFDDGAAIFVQECRWVEIVSSTHSEKHDEVFYGYGAECKETRHLRLEPDRISFQNGEREEIPERAERSEQLQSYLKTVQQKADTGEATVEIRSPLRPSEVQVDVFWDGKCVVFEPE